METNLCVNQNFRGAQCRIITTLDYSNVKTIESAEVIKDINTQLSGLEYDLAILNFSQRFTNSHKLSTRIFNSRALEMIVVGEPIMTVAVTPHAWKLLGELETNLSLPTALETLQNNAISMRLFEVVSLVSPRE